MKPKDFIELRKQAKLTQAIVANKLDVTPRTIASWESRESDKKFSQIETSAIQDLFLPHILDKKLKDMTSRAFSEIPSEFIAIWIVKRNHIKDADCILRPEAIRFEQLSNKPVQQHSPLCVKPLTEVSLTTLPLQKGKLINLTDDEISCHTAKKYPGRKAAHFNDGLCESLLHVPAMLITNNGPIYPLMLSLENKLRPRKEQNSFEVILSKNSKVQPTYSSLDEEIATNLSVQFAKELEKNMELLGMF